MQTKTQPTKKASPKTKKSSSKPKSQTKNKKKTLKEIKEQKTKKAIAEFKKQKETIGDQNIRKEIKNRINRVVGSMNGVKKMVEEGFPCDEVLIQLSAVLNATKGIANYILFNHINNFVSEEIKQGNGEKAIKNAVDYFKRFE